tara:strand:- start:8176 stop:10098 length:1923 start_codon:yes stop_codon:yes gene_type:complete
LFIFWLLTVTHLVGESPWWARRWTERQSVRTGGAWVRVPYEAGIAKGRFVDLVGAEELPHWTQTIEVSDLQSIAVDPAVHYGFPRLIRAKDGRLLLFYRVGISHAKDPATIAQRTSFDGGGSWSAERIIHRDPDGYSAHNPVAVVAPDGRVLLFVSSYNFRHRRKLPMYWAHSDDHGETWSSFTKFDEHPSRSTYYMTDVERTDSGLFGMSAGFAADARTQCHNIFWYSKDGRDWTIRSFHTQPAENRGDEVDLFHLSGERFMVFHRDRRQQTTWRVRSEDAGRTWTEREDLGDQVEILQRPFATRLTDEVTLLSGRDAKRKLVVVYVSRDGGETFGERHVIDSYSADGAYTSAVRLSDRQALLVYYGDRPAFRGKPDIRQVTLTIHDRPTYVCFQGSTNRVHFYSRRNQNETTEDRTFAWLSPPGGWATATINPTKVPRGNIPLLRERTWSGSFPPPEDPDAIAPYWSATKSGNANTKREAERVLRIYDRGAGGGEFAHLGRPWELTPERKAEIEVTLRVISCSAPGGCMLRIADGRNEEAFTFFPDRIQANRSRLEAKVDLSTEFTTLRFTVGDSGYQVRTGDRLLLDGRNKFSSPAHSGRRIIHFGSGSSVGQGEALWKRVSYRITEDRRPVNSQRP